MGYCIECDEPCNKVAQILAREPTARQVAAPTTFPGPNIALVCVVSNGAFEAAGFCYNEHEWRAFTDPADRTRIQPLIPHQQGAE